MGLLGGTLVMAAGAATWGGKGATNVVPIRFATHNAPAVSAAEAERAISSAKDLSLAFRLAADKVLPAVVTVENRPRENDDQTTGRLNNDRGRGDENPFSGTPFEDFFRQRGFDFQVPSPDRSPHAYGSGSGFVVDANGIILTNNHVVEGNGDVTVKLSDGREFKATNVWTDPKTDVAVVKIEATGLPTVALADSDSVEVGQWVIALGQPFGLESSVTAGIISAKHRGIGIAARENFFQTDAAINPGNSGGPLVNLEGQVVGINTAISSKSGGNDGIGFAIPANLAKWVADQLVQGGTVHRAYLGVGIQPVTADLANQFHVKPREGVAVTDVFPGSPAAKAGLQMGDVIVEYAGMAVNSPNELQILVERSKMGTPHALTIIRDGSRHDLTFTPEEQPGDYGTARPSHRGESEPSGTVFERLGIEVSNLTADVAQQLGMKKAEGVVITNVKPAGAADRAGLEEGMVITAVNRTPVNSLEEFSKAVDGGDSQDGILLLVRTSQGSRFVVIQ